MRHPRIGSIRKSPTPIRERTGDAQRVVLDPDKLDTTNRARRTNGDFPEAIAKVYGKWRVFNTGWADNDQTWDDRQYQRKLMLRGFKSAMGLTPAEVSPRPFPGAKSADGH